MAPWGKPPSTHPQNEPSVTAATATWIISLGGMSSLGTVQRCQNPVVLPSLHGGLPPTQTMDRYVRREYN